MTHCNTGQPSIATQDGRKLAKGSQNTSYAQLVSRIALRTGGHDFDRLPEVLDGLTIAECTQGDKDDVGWFWSDVKAQTESIANGESEKLIKTLSRSGRAVSSGQWNVDQKQLLEGLQQARCPVADQYLITIFWKHRQDEKAQQMKDEEHDNSATGSQDGQVRGGANEGPTSGI